MARSVALSLHGCLCPSCLAALLVLSKLTFPLGCPSQTFKSHESGPK